VALKRFWLSWVLRLSTIVVAMICGVVAAEAISRRADGFKVWSGALRPVRAPRPAPRDASPDRSYAIGMPVAPFVNKGWYVETPPAAPRIPMSLDLEKRAAEYPTEPWSPFFEWNLTYLREQACTDTRDVVMGALKDFYYFESPDGSRYPSYRHLRHVSPPGWFATNAFGWRGPDIALNKPPDTIRIAFVGASTTSDAYGMPFSHPELVGHWLNRWAEAQGLRYRFEVINAGRTGIQSNSIAAIVTQELVPVEPDLVIYYEGANQFWPDRVVTVDDGKRHDPPKATFRKRTVAEDYSALVRRVLQLSDRVHAGFGAEPRKPASRVTWPTGIDEFHPAVNSPTLPMDLPNIVACLDIMRTALGKIGGELVVSSFVWLVHDGMRLNVDRDSTLYQYLNRTYWPFTYAELRRVADFQNRVFEEYARTHDLPFIDMAADFPQDPALANDAIHFRYRGLVLQAWIFLQRLIPIVQQRIADGRLPKSPSTVRSVHPAFDQPSPRLVGLSQLRAQCR